MTDLRTAAQQALEALEGFAYHGKAAGWPETITNLRTALAQQDEPAQQTRKDGDYSVAYRCECGHKQNVTEIVRGGRTYAGSGANWCDGCGDGPPVRVDAIQQQAEPKGGGNLPPPLQAEPVTEDMKSAVRWAPSSAYWSERLREFFGPDAREGIDALERRIAGAQERAEPDLSLCPQCNGPADNGHDRSIPPSPYLCTKCMAEPVHKCPNCASLEAQNTELDLKLAEVEQEERDGVDGMPLYTAPPQRKPLTDEEIVRIFETPELAGTHFQTPTLKAIAVARAIERAHGIKERV